MPLLKKLLFAIPFLVLLYLSFIQLDPFLKDPYLIFTLTSQVVFNHQFQTIVGLLVLVLSTVFSSFLFVLLASLAEDLKITLPVSVLAGVVAYTANPGYGLILGIGTFICLSIYSLVVYHLLKSYLNFQPFILFSPPTRNLSKLLSLVFAVVFFISVSKTITSQGFQVPDSLIDAALKFSGQSSLSTTQSQPSSPQTSSSPQISLPSSLPNIQISQDQINMLKQHPELLQQYGLTPAMLDQLTAPKPSSTPKTTSAPSSKTAPQPQIFDVRSLIKNQLNSSFEPYIRFLPYVLTLSFFIVLTTFISLISLILYLLIPATFWVLEQANFIHFTTETREVKKMTL